MIRPQKRPDILSRYLSSTVYDETPVLVNKDGRPSGSLRTQRKNDMVANAV